ncbi:MAG TPA: (2Fe-2S)-binding protein [Thermoanaerobaculia bacterium]|jgi:aerobic-type carbon monoxide dehydrogenase small subunit (CoxS/CutS family)|nr:(2Fe-2S)-binding protein [Thermoanaerobaculia bacterium]
MADAHDSGPPTVSGMSRRAFLCGAGTTAAGSAQLDSGLLQEVHAASLGAGTSRGPGAVPSSLKVNGTARSIQVEPRANLAEVLRDGLHLTGTKVICDRGACSGCTVWLDGDPVNSCMTFALDVGSREVTTIEGLASAGSIHPVQAAFVEHDALQCGYCTPGMVMSCAALLEKNPNPTLAEGATPLAQNAYKLPILETIVRRALLAAGA